jgi:hypothetical protein
MLSSKKPLAKEELDRAKELMVKLREFGFTSLEISRLTNGGWSEPTVKLYTRGSKVKDRSLKDEAMNLLSELADRGLALENVERTLSATRELEGKGLSIKEVSEFLIEAKRGKLRVEEIIKVFKEARDAKLTIQAIKEVLKYKGELESEGLTIEYLKRLYSSCKKLGGYTKLLESVEAYGSIDSIKIEI